MMTLRIALSNIRGWLIYWSFLAIEQLENTYYKLRYGSIPVAVYNKRHDYIMGDRRLLEEIQRTESVLTAVKSICTEYNLEYLETQFVRNLYNFQMGLMFDKRMYVVMGSMFTDLVTRLDVLQLLIYLGDIEQRRIDFKYGTSEAKSEYYTSLNVPIHQLPEPVPA